MSDLENLKKREQEVQTTLKFLHEFIKQRNAVLSSVENLSLTKVLTGKRSFLKANCKNLNFMNLSSKVSEKETKIVRRCLFYLKKRECNLFLVLGEIQKKIHEIENP
jgi:hypothetical protein